MHSAIMARPTQAQQQTENLARFFASQALHPEEVVLAVQKLYPDAQVLFVSSVVQGLAGSTSDVDVIAVGGAGPSGGRAMSDHLMVGGRRIGVTGFPTSEVSMALQELRNTAGRELPNLLRSFAQYEAAQPPISGAELERIVNGTTLDGRLPFGDDANALALTWRARSFDQARQAIICGTLSLRAGERRAPKAYFTQGIRLMKDAVLSSCGHVYSGEKWILLRWERFASSELAAQPAALRALGLRLSRAAESLLESDSAPALALCSVELADILVGAGAELGYAPWASMAIPAFALQGPHGRLLTGAMVWAAHGTGRAFQSDEANIASPAPLQLQACMSLAPEQAKGILNAVRARRLGISLADAGWTHESH